MNTKLNINENKPKINFIYLDVEEIFAEKIYGWMICVKKCAGKRQ